MIIGIFHPHLVIPVVLLSRSSHYQFVDYDDRVNHDKGLFVISQSRRSSTRVRDNKPTYYSHHRPYTGDQVYRLRFHACVVIAGAEPRFCLCATPANCDLQSVTLSFWGAKKEDVLLARKRSSLRTAMELMTRMTAVTKGSQYVRGVKMRGR
jgi:hypothetical protein